jgi:uncharacterized membrane protein
MKAFPRFFPVLLLVSVILLLSLTCTTRTALADTTITVSVRDGKGPVGGAQVAAVVYDTTYSGLTSGTGLVNLTMPNGTYTFMASKEGYRQGSASATVGTDSLVNITLSNLYTVSGTVIDASTGTPRKGATVTVTNKETNVAYPGTTNDNGVFSIEVPNGYYGIAAHATGYEASFMDNNGAGYHLLDNPLYVGYVPVAAIGASTSLNGVGLSSDFPGKSVKVNESVTFDVRITNNGIVDKTFVLSVKEAPAGWNVQLLSGGDVVNRVFVGSKSSQSFQVKTTPLDASSSTITIVAASGDDKGQLQLFVDASQNADYRLELVVPDDISLSAGESRNVEAIVRNNGTGKLSNVMLDIGQDDVPQSLTANVQTRTVDRLDPGQSQRFVIQVYAKADAGTGEDKLYMRATSNEAKTDQKSMQVSYATSNTWLGMGIAIALVAILAFGFIVWKYGRR